MTDSNRGLTVTNQQQLGNETKSAEAFLNNPQVNNNVEGAANYLGQNNNQPTVTNNQEKGTARSVEQTQQNTTQRPGTQPQAMQASLISVERENGFVKSYKITEIPGLNDQQKALIDEVHRSHESLLTAVEAAKDTNDLIKTYNELANLGRQYRDAFTKKEDTKKIEEEYDKKFAELAEKLKKFGVTDPAVIQRLKENPSQLKELVGKLKESAEQNLNTARARFESAIKSAEQGLFIDPKFLAYAHRLVHASQDPKAQGAKPVTLILENPNHETARLYYSQGLTELANVVPDNMKQKLNEKQRIALNWGGFAVKTVKDSKGNDVNVLVSGLDEYYANLAKGRVSTTKKALDPRVAQAYAGFIRHGLCDEKGNRYSDEKLMELWGFTNKQDFAYAKRHLFGSIDENFYVKNKFSGVQNLAKEQDPKKREAIIGKLLQCSHRLVEDDSRRQNELVKLLPYLLIPVAAVAKGYSLGQALQLGANYAIKDLGFKLVANALNLDNNPIFLGLAQYYFHTKVPDPFPLRLSQNVTRENPNNPNQPNPPTNSPTPLEPTPPVTTPPGNGSNPPSNEIILQPSPPGSSGSGINAPIETGNQTGSGVLEPTPPPNSNE